MTDDFSYPETVRFLSLVREVIYARRRTERREWLRLVSPRLSKPSAREIWSFPEDLVVVFCSR